MMRSVAAIVAGYLVFGVTAAILFATSGQDPHLMPAPGFLISPRVSRPDARCCMP